MGTSCATATRRRGDEKVRSLRAPKQLIKPKQHTFRPWSKMPDVPPKPYFRGPELVPKTSPQQHENAIHSSEEPFRPGQHFPHLQQATCIPVVLKKWAPCGTRSSGSGSSSSSRRSSSSKLNFRHQLQRHGPRYKPLKCMFCANPGFLPLLHFKSLTPKP